MTTVWLDELGVMTDKGVEVVLPNGDGCFYVHTCPQHPGGMDGCSMCHSYWRRKEDGTRGVRLTGVTTVTKVMDLDPRALLRWAARTNGIGVALLAGPVIRGLAAGEADPAAAQELLWLCSHERIWETLEQHSLTYEDVRDAKSVVGTNIHEQVFQVLGTGAPMFNLDALTLEEQGYARGVVGFWLDHDPQAQYVEQIVVDTERGVAGRLDFLGTLGSTCDDEQCPCHTAVGPGIIDAKTGYVGTSAHAQTEGYAELAEHCGLVDQVAWCATLRVYPDGGYQLIPSEAEHGDFELAVRLYRRITAIDREAEKKRKARPRPTL